jgi:hypothetical protein
MFTSRARRTCWCPHWCPHEILWTFCFLAVGQAFSVLTWTNFQVSFQDCQVKLGTPLCAEGSVKWHIVCIMLSPTPVSHWQNTSHRPPGHDDAPHLWMRNHHLRLGFSTLFMFTILN